MNLTITPELERLIEHRMKTGRYATPQDVMTAALCRLDEDEKLGEFEAGELARLLQEGEDSGLPLDGETVLDELKRLRARE